MPYQVVLVNLLDDKASQRQVIDLHNDSFDLLEQMQSSDGLLSKLHEIKPQLLMLFVERLSPTELEMLEEIHRNMPLPVAVFANQHIPQVTELATKYGIGTYIVGKFEASRLPVIMELAITRFNEHESLVQELEQAKNKLAERKLIDRAKGILMQQKKISEQDAYAQLRKTAMNNGKTIGQISKRIIEVFDLLD